MEELEGQILGGRRLRVKFDESGEGAVEDDVEGLTDMIGAHGMWDEENDASGPPDPQFTGLSLYVSNLSWGLNESSLMALFSCVGERAVRTKTRSENENEE